MYALDNHFYGGNGIVGAQISLATGIGWSIKMLKQDTVCIGLMGDGAVNQGQVYEVN